MVYRAILTGRHLAALLDMAQFANRAPGPPIAVARLDLGDDFNMSRRSNQRR